MKDYPSPRFTWLACSAAFGGFSMGIPIEGPIDVIGAIVFAVVGAFCAIKSLIMRVKQ